MLLLEFVIRRYQFFVLFRATCEESKASATALLVLKTRQHGLQIVGKLRTAPTGENSKK
jgi:hypothetical protein